MIDIWQELEGYIRVGMKVKAVEDVNDFIVRRMGEVLLGHRTELQQLLSDSTLSANMIESRIDKFLKEIVLSDDIYVSVSEEVSKQVGDIITSEMKRISDKFMVVLNNAAFQAKDDILKSLRLKQ